MTVSMWRMRVRKNLGIHPGVAWLMFLTKKRRKQFQREAQFSFGLETKTDILMEKFSKLLDERVCSLTAETHIWGYQHVGAS